MSLTQKMWDVALYDKMNDAKKLIIIFLFKIFVIPVAKSILAAERMGLTLLHTPLLRYNALINPRRNFQQIYLYTISIGVEVPGESMILIAT